MNRFGDNVVVFDGVCNLCTSASRWILRHDHREVFQVVPAQSEAGRELLRPHGLDGDRLPSLVVLRQGQALLRSEAVLEIARHLGGGWPLLRLFRVVPRRLLDWLYDGLARHRYRWFGRNEVCVRSSASARPRTPS